MLKWWEILNLIHFQFHYFLFWQNGGKILFATDDGFAVAENLLKVSCNHLQFFVQDLFK